MELDEKQVKELEDKVYNRVIDELSKKYYLIEKTELDELTKFVKGAADKIKETKRKMSDCGCNGSALQPNTVSPDDNQGQPDENDGKDEDKPSLREAWKVDDPIYEFEPPTPGSPTIFSILKYVTINLVWHIDTIYNCHMSLWNIELWILTQAIPAMTYLSAQPVVTAGISDTGTGAVPPHFHTVESVGTNIPAISLAFFPMPRFIAPISPPEGPAHYFIGNEIPET